MPRMGALREFFFFSEEFVMFVPLYLFCCLVLCTIRLDD